MSLTTILAQRRERKRLRAEADTRPRHLTHELAKSVTQGGNYTVGPYTGARLLLEEVTQILERRPTLEEAVLRYQRRVYAETGEKSSEAQKLLGICKEALKKVKQNHLDYIVERMESVKGNFLGKMFGGLSQRDAQLGYLFEQLSLQESSESRILHTYLKILQQEKLLPHESLTRKVLIKCLDDYKYNAQLYTNNNYNLSIIAAAGRHPSKFMDDLLVKVAKKQNLLYGRLYAWETSDGHTYISRDPDFKELPQLKNAVRVEKASNYLDKHKLSVLAACFAAFSIFFPHTAEHVVHNVVHVAAHGVVHAYHESEHLYHSYMHPSDEAHTREHHKAAHVLHPPLEKKKAEPKHETTLAYSTDASQQTPKPTQTPNVAPTYHASSLQP